MAGASREGVVTGGTWCADHNKLVDIWPSEDQLAEILSEEWQGGGPGCNLAVDIKHLDPTMFVETIGLVGDDEDGRRLVAEADTNGIVRTQLHVTTDAPTNYTDAYSSQLTGRRTHIFYAGTSALLSPDHFDFEKTSARLLHLGLPGIHRLMDGPWNGDENGWVTVLKRARAAGLLTNMELVSARADLIARTVRPCLPHLDYLIVNDVEIGAVAGVPTTSVGETDLSACAAALRTVMDMGSMRFAVVHFPAGAIALERGGELLIHPSVNVPPTAIVGSNGAGDAFAAGVIFGVLQGWPTLEAVRLGHAAAAASLRSITTTGSVEDWKQCLSLAEELGWRTETGERIP